MARKLQKNKLKFTERIESVQEQMQTVNHRLDLRFEDLRQQVHKLSREGEGENARLANVRRIRAP